MKIDGPNKTSGPKGPSKAGGAKSTGSTAFSGLIDDTDEAAGSSGSSGASSITRLDALLSLQEAGDSTSEEAARRAKKRGLLLLDELDVLRMGILTGTVTQGQLGQLERMLKSHRDNVIDPVLGSVLDEIDLRVQVELAKFGRR
ncbi:MAG: flagellar assembly protein FliX [Alphaproteobacteria bacterium]|nr:flagellar assembly protein FliX [Alphaproteobacteria bacterium]